VGLRTGMERQVPDVFDVFALGQGGGRGGGGPWDPRLMEQGSKWAHRRSPCERPRTYDKFYQKNPGNFKPEERDSAISVCSSEECEPYKKQKRRKPRRSQSERRVRNRTLTESDVKHLERHLSMKRTIRKKIMQDLQHAFVRSPDRNSSFHIQSLDVGGALEPNVLDLLRDSDDSGHHSPTSQPRMRGRRATREGSGGIGKREGAVKKVQRVERRDTPPPDYEGAPAERSVKERSWWRRLVAKLRGRS